MRHGIKASLAAAVAALFALGVPAGAQSLGQPVYESIDRWEALGYIDRLYVLRPYSPEELSRILEAVIAAGTPADAAEAQAFMADLGSGGLSLAARHVSGASAGTGGARYAGISSAGLSVAANPADSLWLSGGVDLALQDGRQAVLPYGRRGDFELNDDPSMNFLPAGLSGDAMGLLYALSSNVWFGSASLWGSASYARSSAGPFWNNGIFIGPQASAAPNWTLHASFGPWRYSSALFQLVPKGPGSYAHEKYLAFHSYSFSPAAGLDLGVLETVVWAGTFKPLYLVPLSMLFYMQSLAGTGYGDNSLAGVYASWRAAPGLVLKASAYFDDVGMNDILKLRFDTKIIGAVQGGLAWAPPAGYLRLVSLDYTAVFPYMYAHHTDYDSTQDNYTHFGDSFGAALQPNSDRLELRVRLRPAERLKAEAFLGLFRHGNASEGINGGDGSWFDDGWIGETPSYQPPFESATVPRYFRFLSQDVIETVAQLGASLSWTPALERSLLSVECSYTFEYSWNRDLVAGARGCSNYLGLTLSWRL